MNIRQIPPQTGNHVSTLVDTYLLPFLNNTETLRCLPWKHRGHFVQLPGVSAQWYFLKQKYSPGTSLNTTAGIHLGHCSYSCKTVSTITFCFLVLIAFQSKRNLDWFLLWWMLSGPKFFLGKTTKLNNLVSQRKKKKIFFPWWNKANIVLASLVNALLKPCSKNHRMSENNNSNNHIGHAPFHVFYSGYEYHFVIDLETYFFSLCVSRMLYFIILKWYIICIYLNDVFIIFIILRSNFFITKD